jgi:sulfate permease, SulP family
LHGMVLTSLVSMTVAIVAPRLPVVGKLLPGPLVAIVVAIAFSWAISPWFPQRTLAQAAGQATFAGGWNSLPAWNFPAKGVDWYDGKMWVAVLTTAPRMALVGLVESILTVKLLDQMTGTSGSTRRECFGQGLGNIAAALFGTQGGCALIGQSLINLSGGAQGRLSGFTMASGLFVSVVLLAPIVGKIPVAALVGLMFLVAINTFAWGSLGLYRIISWTDGLVIIIVMIVTLAADLATAVITGMFISALAFAWNAAKEVKLEEESDGSTRTFKLQGPLFFGSAMSFQSRIRPERIPEPEVMLDFAQGNILDHSALDAITKTVDRLMEAGKKVRFHELPPDAKDYLRSMSLQPHIDH